MQSSNTSCTSCDNTVLCFTNVHTFLVLLEAWVAAAAAIAASAFWGDRVFSVVASSLPLLLLLLLVPPAGRASEGTATGGGTGAGSVLPPEDSGVDVLAQPALPGGITVRDLGFLHPYTTTPLSYITQYYHVSRLYLAARLTVLWSAGLTLCREIFPQLFNPTEPKSSTPYSYYPEVWKELSSVSDAVKSGRGSRVFQRNVLPPSSELYSSKQTSNFQVEWPSNPEVGGGAVHSSWMFVNFYQTTCHHIPDNSHCCEGLISRLLRLVNPLTTFKTYFCKKSLYYYIPPLIASSLQTLKPNFCMHFLCSKIWVQISSHDNKDLTVYQYFLTMSATCSTHLSLLCFNRLNGIRYPILWILSQTGSTVDLPLENIKPPTCFTILRRALYFSSGLQTSKWLLISYLGSIFFRLSKVWVPSIVFLMHPMHVDHCANKVPEDHNRSVYKAND
jgi:hypothetical protein